MVLSGTYWNDMVKTVMFCLTALSHWAVYIEASVSRLVFVL